MPTNGIFTQTSVILLREPISIDAIASHLDDYEPSAVIPPTASWHRLGPAVVIDFTDDEVSSAVKVIVDVVDQPWPDAMGKDDPEAQQAWKRGHFGHCTFPGALHRATQQSWNWAEGRSEPQTHTAFIRIRSSYVFDADNPAASVQTDGDSNNTAGLPDKHDPFEDMVFVTDLAMALLELPQAICYFNPGGEVVRNLETFEQSCDESKQHDIPPTDLWTNVRMFNVGDDWSVMDSIGGHQFDFPDSEACFHFPSYQNGEVYNLLRSIVLHLLTNGGDAFADGDTTEGPGDVMWKVHYCESSLVDPPRKVLRWFPQDGREIPETMRAQ